MAKVYAVRSPTGRYLKRSFPKSGRSWTWTDHLSEARLYSQEAQARRQMDLAQNAFDSPRGSGLLEVVEVSLGDPRVVGHQ